MQKECFPCVGDVPWMSPCSKHTVGIPSRKGPVFPQGRWRTGTPRGDRCLKHAHVQAEPTPRSAVTFTGIYFLPSSVLSRSREEEKDKPNLEAALQEPNGESFSHWLHLEFILLLFSNPILHILLSFSALFCVLGGWPPRDSTLQTWTLCSIGCTDPTGGIRRR